MTKGSAVVDIMEKYQNAGGDRQYADILEYLDTLEKSGYTVIPLADNKVVLVDPPLP